eukprot:gene24221-9820_t
MTADLQRLSQARQKAIRLLTRQVEQCDAMSDSFSAAAEKLKTLQRAATDHSSCMGKSQVSIMGSSGRMALQGLGHTGTITASFLSSTGSLNTLVMAWVPSLWWDNAGASWTIQVLAGLTSKPPPRPGSSSASPG